MNRFLIVLSMFIGIVAYNVYVPNPEHFQSAAMLESKRIAGVFVAIFFAGSSFYALKGLHNYRTGKTKGK